MPKNISEYHCAATRYKANILHYVVKYKHFELFEGYNLQKFVQIQYIYLRTSCNSDFPIVTIVVLMYIQVLKSFASGKLSRATYVANQIVMAIVYNTLCYCFV